MNVLIGSARLDENGKIANGQVGDQTGKEVSTQNWYLHKKGWVVIRAKDKTKANKIATAMEAACKNNNIGYDQTNRNSLYNAIKNKDFDPSKCTTKVETDCSALVRVCCNYAGIKVGDFNTSSEVNVLSKTNAFTVLKDKKYTTSADYLERGDILVTATKGHTVVVLSDGAKIRKQISVQKKVEIKPALSEQYIGYVTASTLNIREKASIDSGILGVLTKGSKVKIVDEKNGWGQLSDRGWVSLSYIAFDVIVTASFLNMRTKATANSLAKGALKKGTICRIDKVENNWGRIENKNVWISLAYTKKA